MYPLQNSKNINLDAAGAKPDVSVGIAVSSGSEGDERTAELIDEISNTAKGLKYDFIVGNDDSCDHSSFAQSGVPAVTLIDWDADAVYHVPYHVPEDTIDNIGAGNLTKNMDVAMNVIGKEAYSSIKDTPFNDVPAGYMHEHAIKWAYDNNIIVGSDNKFGPEDNLTEAQFVVMLTKYGNVPYDETYAGRALEPYNLPLDGNTNLSAKDKPINRGRIAQIVAAVYGLDYSIDDAIMFMYANNFSAGTSTTLKTVETYGKDLNFIRASAASSLQKMSGVTQVVDIHGNVIQITSRQVIGKS